ncbi:endosome-associated-trafficking regulator 1 isoform X2 [Microcaecilia unicolor]|uniref:Endosome-associated-trafficking regulator 1 n=1 Tax=Microcaecilia unicolor TaxID=1415580 RepID=A0A6P7YKH3_9AMPH|nr:endosome-associated-trafficking regulator 1 isoform X2 [Microcaecilia unicolor]
MSVRLNDGTLKEDETNPFSFKEFVKSKNRSAVKNEEQNNKMYQKGSPRPTVMPDNSPFVLNETDVNPDFQETFFKDPTLDDILDDDEEDGDWSGSYQPSVIEESQGARTAGPSLSTTYDSFSLNPSELAGIKSFVTWQLNDSNDFKLHSTDQDFVADRSPVEHVDFYSLQKDYENVKEENSQLWRTIKELQMLNETQTEKVRNLERKLEAKMIEDEKEAWDLESVVQQVEQNLQMMTTELGMCRTENEALRLAEKASVAAVKQNTHIALENLHKVINNAQSFVTQLMSGADSLNLVAELLKSVDKIYELKGEDDQ